jgi:hypothetical protein
MIEPEKVKDLNDPAFVAYVRERYPDKVKPDPEDYVFV